MLFCRILEESNLSGRKVYRLIERGGKSGFTVVRMDSDTTHNKEERFKVVADWVDVTITSFQDPPGITTKIQSNPPDSHLKTN